MSRPQHNRKDFEEQLKRMERAGWTVSGGGNKHFKCKCPGACKCLKTMATTPSNPNYLRDFKAQLRRQTCWKED